MILHNPTKEAVSITSEGNVYTIEAGKSLLVPEKVGSYWKNKIHNFLQIQESPEIIEIDEEVIVTREAMVDELGKTEVKKIEDEAEEIGAIAVIKKALKKTK